MFVIVFKHATEALFNWIYKLFTDLKNWISSNYNNIILAIAIIFSILLFGTVCFLSFKRWINKKRQLDEDLDDEYLLEENLVDQERTIYIEGNLNENIHGDFIEIHGNQININNDFTEVANQLSELVEHLKNQGCSQEDAEKEIARELEEESLNKPKVKKTLRRWRKSFSKKNNAASDKEIAQEVVKTATSYSYSSSRNFTDVIGGDFHTLNELLQCKKWKEADWETAKIIYAIAQNELPAHHEYKDDPPDCIVEEHIKVIPKKYLKNIDNLWKKHSNGRFGFSVQKRILKTILKDDNYLFYPYFFSSTVSKFGDLVDWRKEGDWLYYVDLYDSLKTAAPGHLPLAYMLSSDELEKCRVNFDIFVVICERL
ncbi:MAG: GUN4 domain-containing protein [Rivularia sp. (in: cyanobacteria)]